MKRPPTLTPLTTGNSSSSETTPFSSAAVVVIILKVEPGGWGAEKAWPASARTLPLRASRTAMPPDRPASAETAETWRAGSIVVFTGAPAFGSDWARMRAELPEPATASSEPPGLPASRALNACSRPLTPTGVSGAKPWRARAGRSAASAIPTSPVTSIAALPRGCTRASAGPSASVEPSAARIGARGASAIWFSRCSPRCSPGKTRLGSQSIPPSAKGRSTSASTGPKATVSASIVTGTTVAPPVEAGFRGESGSSERSVAHFAGVAVGGGEVIDRDSPFRGRVQLSVHRGEFVVCPSFGEPLGGVLLGRAGRAG